MVLGFFCPVSWDRRSPYGRGARRALRAAFQAPGMFVNVIEALSGGACAPVSSDQTSARRS